MLRRRYHPCLHLERRSLGGSRDATVGFVTLDPCNPPTVLLVCCLSRLLKLRRGLIFATKSAKMGGCGCCDDRGNASLQGVLWWKACPDCVLDHCLDARLACHEGSQVCKSRCVSRCFVPDSGLTCTECRLRVLRETWEEPFERPPNLVITSAARCSWRIVWPCTRTCG